MSYCTYEEYKEVVNRPCTYCGLHGPVGADRLDNSLGHALENIIPACSTCNRIRSDQFTYKETMIIGKAIREIRERRND